MFYARVYLTSPNFDMDIGGHPCPTPREARCSAAANMIAELKKAEEEEERDTLSDNLWNHYFYLNFELNSMRTLSSYFTF